MGSTKRHSGTELSWLGAMDRLRAEQCEQVLPGFKTIVQISAEIGKGAAQTARIVERLLSAGRAERRVFKISSGKVIRPIPHFRIL